jgi:glycosyltransferase involved in cell wall biosynthesis
MQPSVSVVIPAYNAEKYLQEAVTSVLRQSVPPVEILIVDDGSTDSTLAMARDLERQHPQITALTRPNGGSGPARNTGLAQASGEFLLFLDADDRLHENAIRDHLTAFAQRPEVAMVFGANDVIDAQGALLNPNPTPVEDVTLQDLAMRVIPIPSQSMYKKAAVDRIGGYNERFRNSQDVDLNLRLARIGQIFSHGMKVVDYRRHAAQATSNRAQSCNAHAQVLESNFGKAAASPDPILLKKAKARLYSRFGRGQIRAALDALRRGHFADAGSAARLAALRLKARVQGQVWHPTRR